MDKIADMLPGWKTALMSTAGRAVLVKAVLTAVPVYWPLHLMCLSGFSMPLISYVKLSYIWKGCRQVNGGHCPVAWERACCPEELGGLGVHNLETL